MTEDWVGASIGVGLMGGYDGVDGVEVELVGL